MNGVLFIMRLLVFGDISLFFNCNSCCLEMIKYLDSEEERK